jgi:hypothetical protein
MSASPESMTLRQKMTEGEHLARELIQHLEQGFLPKVQHVRRLTRPHPEAGEEELREVTLRNAVEEILASDDFTRQLSQRVRMFAASIEADIGRIVHEGQ